jgi:hypothetical protein
MSEVKVNKISPRTNCGTVTVGDAGDSVTVTAGVPVTVNGDLKSNALKAVDGGSIISQCGTNITLGASGDTINLAAGASQTGFGRTGTVDWDTTAKTAGFTAVSGTGYFVNTTSGAITVTLPASPSAGDIVALSDYTGTWGTNNITVGRNSSNINGAAADLILNADNTTATLIYVDGTEGWRVIDTGSLSEVNVTPGFVAATGGTIATTPCGNFKTHTFTGPGTFEITCAGNSRGSTLVEYIVVAGGGSGGTNGGGGGAGGFRFASPTLAPATYPAKPLAAPAAITASISSFPITVGGGGTGGPYPRSAPGGSASTFSTITSAGGGGGRGNQEGNPQNGGSGGGGSYPCQPSGGNGPGGSGNTPPVSPPQGNNGGTGGIPQSSGGGGGALAVGSNAPGPEGGPGGVGGGVPNAFGTSGQNCGSFYYFSGGGGGARQSPSSPLRGTGGLGGGATAGVQEGGASSGTANTGGGGGGAAGGDSVSGSGGSGIVIIRYKIQ